MRGLMQDKPMLMTSMPGHGATYFPDVEIVSRTIEGPNHRDGDAEAEARRRGESMAGLPSIEIEYCRGRKFPMRASWRTQELLSTFEDVAGGVTLRPGSGAVFIVRVDGDIVWSRQEAGRFPETKELRRGVRDRVAPDRRPGDDDTVDPS